MEPDLTESYRRRRSFRNTRVAPSDTKEEGRQSIYGRDPEGSIEVNRGRCERTGFLTVSSGGNRDRGEHGTWKTSGVDQSP